MAATVQTIALFKKYVDLLDEVYKFNTLTGDLDMDPALVRAGANANEIVIPKMSFDKLANYSRNSGYTQGAVVLTNETVQFNYDRGRKFDVDAMDNEETAGVAFGKLASEFMRVAVVPEMDARTFAQLAQTANISHVATPVALAAGTDWIAAISAAMAKMDEDEVPMEGRILYITPTGYRAIQDLDTTKSREVLGTFAKIKQVPQTRFYTKIQLLDGTTTGQEAGGYAKASDGAEINFMIVHPSAVMKHQKHTVSKIVSPQDNQTSDGWLFFYRAYGLVDVYDNKVAGIYLHNKPASI